MYYKKKIWSNTINQQCINWQINKIRNLKLKLKGKYIASPFGEFYVYAFCVLCVFTCCIMKSLFFHLIVNKLFMM